MKKTTDIFTTDTYNRYSACNNCKFNELKDLQGQELIESIEEQLNGWTLALISTGKHGVRLQLQSEPPESEDTGKIVCITAPTLEEAIQKAIMFSEKHQLENKLKNNKL